MRRPIETQKPHEVNSPGRQGDRSIHEPLVNFLVVANGLSCAGLVRVLPRPRASMQYQAFPPQQQPVVLSLIISSTCVPAPRRALCTTIRNKRTWTPLPSARAAQVIRLWGSEYMQRPCQEWTAANLSSDFWIQTQSCVRRNWYLG
eukprot:COSAG06_NODE_12141_length_1419_cov_0.771212_2_plen_146_part_00